MTADTARVFPIQDDYRQRRWGSQHVHGPRSIPWERAAQAYVAYSTMYGTLQSLERMAERGGFGWYEFLSLHIAWQAMERHRIAGTRLTHQQLHTSCDYYLTQFAE